MYEFKPGERIIELCKERNITQYRLAIMCNRTPSFVSNLIIRSSNPNMKGILTICEALDITPNEFFKIDQIDYNDKMEKSVMKNFRKLNSNHKKAVDLIIKGLLDRSDE